MFLLFFLLVGMGLLWALWIVPGIGTPHHHQPVRPPAAVAPPDTGTAVPTVSSEPAEPSAVDAPAEPALDRPARSQAPIPALAPAVSPAIATALPMLQSAALADADLHALARQLAAQFTSPATTGIDTGIDVEALRRTFERLLAGARPHTAGPEAGSR